MKKLILLLPCLLLGNGKTIAQHFEKQFAEKAAIITTNTAEYYTPPGFDIGDPEKYYWPKAIARFALHGVEDSLSNAWIEHLSHRSPFHFTLVGMARLMYLYPDAPAMQRNRQLILEKVFSRRDGHNAWTSEGTENHISMARTSGYLYAQAALGNKEFPEATAKLEQMKAWILAWAKQLYQNGPGEWNSSIYEVYNLIGWLNLYDFAEDAAVVLAARAVLDFYATEMALHFSFGGYGGSEMRGTGATDLDTNASNYLCWLWFGKPSPTDPLGMKGSQYIQLMHPITSGYRPPAPVLALAEKKGKTPGWYIGSKPAYLFEEKAYVKQFFYTSSSFTLGSYASGYGGWTGASYQIIPWKLTVNDADSYMPHLISGNGRFHDEWSGKTQNPWTQVAQHHQTLVQMTLTPANADATVAAISQLVNDWKARWKADYALRFPEDEKENVVNMSQKIINRNDSYLNFPAEAEILDHKGFYLIELAEVFMAAIPLSAKNTSQLLVENNRKLLVDTAPLGDVCGFILEVREKSTLESLDIFEGLVRKNHSSIAKGEKSISYTNTLGSTLKVSYQDTGSFTEAMYDWGYGPSQPMSMPTSPPFRQPEWPKGFPYGRIPQVQVNGENIPLRSSDWPVYEGPGLKMEKAILSINHEGWYYEVDFTGENPSFRTFLGAN